MQGIMQKIKRAIVCLRSFGYFFLASLTHGIFALIHGPGGFKDRPAMAAAQGRGQYLLPAYRAGFPFPAPIRYGAFRPKTDVRSGELRCNHKRRTPGFPASNPGDTGARHAGHSVTGSSGSTGVWQMAHTRFFSFGMADVLSETPAAGDSGSGIGAASMVRSGRLTDA